MIKMNFLAHNFFNRLFLIAAIVLTAASALSARSQQISSTDFMFTRISGNSMLPTLNSGETATVYKAYPFKKLRVGDIVIIKSERGYNVIHRIVRRYRGGMWVTQGDNNRREDREVLSKRNFGGLALVEQSMVRYQNYVTSLEGAPASTHSAQVALADQNNTLDRFSRLANL